MTYANPAAIPALVSAQLGGWAQQDLWILDYPSLPVLGDSGSLLDLATCERCWGF